MFSCLKIMKSRLGIKFIAIFLIHCHWAFAVSVFLKYNIKKNLMAFGVCLYENAKIKWLTTL